MSHWRNLREEHILLIVLRNSIVKDCARDIYNINMSAPPSYDDIAGSSSGGPPPLPPSHNFQQGGGGGHQSAQAEKQQLQAHYAHSSSHDTGSKVLKIWHAPSGNSLITAADEKTPIYNVIDSRAPDEQEQRAQSQAAQQQFESRRGQSSDGGAPSHAGMTRRDPTSATHQGDSEEEIRFAQEIAQQRANPQASRFGYGGMSGGGGPRPAEIWQLRVRRGADRNSPPIATIKRHFSTKSDVAIEMHGERNNGSTSSNVKTGIEQHAGFPHTKYDFHWQGRLFTWTKTHKAPGTSRLDSGNFICRDDRKQIYAYSTSEDDRCDGSLQFEDRAVDEGLLDIMTITGFIMRDLETERTNPSFMRYGAGYGYGGYGPYASPFAANYGFYPYGIGFPLLL